MPFRTRVFVKTPFHPDNAGISRQLHAPMPARPWSQRLLRLATLPAVLGAAFPVQAQQAPAPESAPIQTVQVQGRAADYDPRRDDTAARIVVGHEDIVRYGDTNLLDVLKRIAGVTVSGSAGRGAEIRMQGLGNGYTQVLVNGERPPAGMAVETLAPESIERIEVLRVASAEYSSQSIAGTINIVLKKAAKKAERELKVGYAAGHDTRSPNADLRVADNSGAFSYTLAGSVVHDHFQGEVPSRAQETDRGGRLTLLRTTAGHEDGRMTTMNLVPQLTWKLDGGDSLGLETFLNVNRFRIDVNAPTTTLQGAPPPYQETRIGMNNENDALRSELHWVHGLASGARLDMKFGGSASRTNNGTTRDAGGNPEVGPLLQRIDANGRDHGVQSTGKLTVPLWEGHALAMGWDSGYDRRTADRHERDLLNPSSTAPGGEDRFTGRIARLAAYVQDEWDLTPDWSIYLGTRWEGVRISAEGTDFGHTRSNSSIFSPVLQTLYKLPTKQDQLRLAVSRTYKAPGMDQLLPHRYPSVNNSQVEPDTLGNPNLKPELALGIDAAWEHNWAEGALLSLSASARDIDDYTRYLVQFDGSRWISMPGNVGKARNRSVQLETSFPLATLFASAPAIDVRANVARNWSRVDGVPGPDNRLDQQAPLSANLGFDYRRGELTTGANFSFRSAGTVRVAANQAAYLNVRRDLEMYALWNLDAGRRLRVTGLNLLGQDMVNERSYLNTDTGTLQKNRIVNVGNPSIRVTFESSF